MIRNCALALSLSSLACTTALYQGPQKSPQEIAIVHGGTGTTIASIDKAEVDGGRFEQYEVLPGRHALQFDGRAGQVIGPRGLCIATTAGHSYVVETFAAVDHWELEVRDETMGRGVSRAVCSNRGAPESAPDGTEAVLPHPHLPRMGLFLGVGYEFGGTNLIKASLSNGEDRSIDAGMGAVFPLGGTLTPLWIGDVVGLGVGGRVAVKAQSIKAKNGSVTLLRYPLSAWLQSYVTLSPAWFLSLAGGTNKDLDPALSGDGVASELKASFSSSWGWFVDGGVLWLDTWHFGCGFSLRYTGMRYHFAGNSLDASSFGLAMTINLNR